MILVTPCKGKITPEKHHLIKVSKPAGVHCAPVKSDPTVGIFFRSILKRDYVSFNILRLTIKYVVQLNTFGHLVLQPYSGWYDHYGG